MTTKAMITVFLFLSLFGLNASLYRKHYYVNRSMTWSAAQWHCKTNYDDLSIVSNKELKPFSDDPQITEDFYWIGLYLQTIHLTSNWIWTGGQDASDVNWDRHEPSSLWEKCGAVKRSSARVHNAPCEWAIPFYCMEVFELIPVQQESTWEEALLYCRQNYIDLAILSSDTIMTEAKYKSTAALTDDVWIGLRFIAGHWFWANGEAFEYKVWSSDGELKCPAMNQRCAVLNRNSMVWKPVDCEQRFNFLCVKKMLN